ncbi:hypothetical protein BT96DRAFT_924215, partial [Gymnopus androsaceus JB14]
MGLPAPIRSDSSSYYPARQLQPFAYPHMEMQQHSFIPSHQPYFPEPGPSTTTHRYQHSPLPVISAELRPSNMARDRDDEIRDRRLEYHPPRVSESYLHSRRPLQHPLEQYPEHQHRRESYSREVEQYHDYGAYTQGVSIFHSLHDQRDL